MAEEFTLQSEWDPLTAGGCLSYPSWRHNRQYLLEIYGPGTLQLTLERAGAVSSPLGLYLFEHRDAFQGRVLDASTHRTVHKAFKRAAVVKCQIEVPNEHVTRWVLMPCTFDPGQCGPFTLRGHVLNQGPISARISAREISLDLLNTIVIKGQWTAQSAGGSILSAQFGTNPQYRLSLTGDTHVTVIQPRADFEDLIGLYLATVTPRGVNRWSAPALIDDAVVTRVTAECHDVAVTSMSDFSLNTEAHAMISTDGTKKEMLLVPSTAQCGTTGSFELHVTHSRDTHVTVSPASAVSYRNKLSAGHVLNRWQYLLVPDITKYRQQRAEFDVTVTIDLPNLDKASDDYGFYLLKAPDSLRMADDVNLAQSKIGQRHSTRAAVNQTIRLTVDTDDMWLIVPYASVTCDCQVSVAALRADQTFIFRPQLEYCHSVLSDTWCQFAAGADVTAPHFNLYESFILTLDDRQQADGSGDTFNHVIKLVLTSALPDLDIGLALLPRVSRDRLVDCRTSVLMTKYGKSVVELTMALERDPKIDFALGDCTKIIVVPLVRHTSGRDFTLTVVSNSSARNISLVKSPQRALTAIKGKWTSETAGGGLDHVTWRNNPHYLMTFPKKENNSVTATLMLDKNGKSKNIFESIGLCSYAVNSFQPTGAKKKFLLSSRDHIIPPLTSEHTDVIMHRVTLDTRTDYVVMPFTEFPNLELDYELVVSTDEHVTVTEITREARDHWHAVQFSGEWTNTCAGGTCQSRDSSDSSNGTWATNPWCLVHVAQPGYCTVLLQQLADTDLTLHHIGFDMVRVKDASVPLTSGAVVSTCEYKRAKEVGAEFSLDSAQWLYLVPSTLQPGLLSKFVATIYSSSPLIIHRDHRSVTGVTPSPARSSHMSVARSTSSDKYHHVIDEILQTERSYVNSLQIVIERFMNPLLTASHVVSVTDVKRLFSNMPVLLNINQQLLAELQSERDLRPAAPRLGHVFNKFSEYLKVYADYCNEFETAADLLKEFMKQKSFKEFLELNALTPSQKCAGQPTTSSSPGRLSLADYLIMPVQRIPRYVLLLEELTKSGNSFDDELLSAAKKIKQTADLINEKKRQRDSNQVVLQIQQLLVYGEGDKARQVVQITAPHRTYKTEGALYFINAQKQQVLCHVFMFNDILLITKPRKTSSGKTQYELKKQFPLAVCTLDPNLSTTRFALTIDNKTYVLQANSEKQKQEWTINISTLINAELQRELSSMQNRVLVHQRTHSSPSNSNSFEKDKKR